MIIVGVVVGAIAGGVIAFFGARTRAKAIVAKAEADGEMIKKEKMLQAKEKFIQLKSEHDRQVNERNQKLQQSEQRAKQTEASLQNKERELDKKSAEYDRKKEQLEQQMQSVESRKEELAAVIKEQNVRLEQISGMSSEDAKNILIENMKAEAKADAAAYVAETIEEAKLSATKEAKRIVVASIQRVATETAIENAVTVFNIESDEVKGRIIGREGRNIRALEAATGIEIIVDDTPEAIILSGFDPVRREIARLALHQLVTDGRIHPARIEEIVQKVTREIQNKIYEEGEKVLFDLGIHNMSQDGVRALGRLYFRTSYGQNVLNHSKEVAIIAGMLAAEIGANRELAKRAAVLHDIGKGAENDSDQNHAEVGMDMVRKMNEDPKVVNAVGAHHNDIEPSSIEAIIVQIADAISAARPGARRETMDNYVKRLENLETIAESFAGVEKAYAIQAGRELRVLVNNEKIPEMDVKDLARNIAKQIESDLRYPGRIKITMIRETRIIEYAR